LPLLGNKYPFGLFCGVKLAGVRGITSVGRINGSVLDTVLELKVFEFVKVVGITEEELPVY
jgi:hypothetical protein